MGNNFDKENFDFDNDFVEENNMEDYDFVNYYNLAKEIEHTNE